MSELNPSLLLAAWLDGSLNDQQRSQFEQLCSADPEFAKQVETANAGLSRAMDYAPQPVPNWSRAGTWSAPEPANRWQGAGLPVASLLCSLFAVVLVFSGFEASWQQGTLTVSFQSDNERVEQLVDKRLAEFRQTQQQALTAYAQSLREQQLDASAQLTNYLLASSRQERKQDFGELIKFINEQRSEDQVFYTRQINQLQQEIYNQPSLEP